MEKATAATLSDLPLPLERKKNEEVDAVQRNCSGDEEEYGMTHASAARIYKQQYNFKLLLYP